MMIMAPTTDFTLTLSSSQAGAVQEAVQQWTDHRLITSTLASQLLSTLDVQDSFDWQRFAKYTFRLAIISLTIAVTSVLFDDSFMKLLRRILSIPAWLRSLQTAAIAVGVHYWGCQRQIARPFQVWTNESVHALGGLIAGLAALQLAEAQGLLYDEPRPRRDNDMSDEERQKYKEETDKEVQKRTTKVHRILLLLTIAYGATGLVTQSNFIWSVAMIVFSTWFGAVSGYL
jgi:gas vesicle protein